MIRDGLRWHWDREKRKKRWGEGNEAQRRDDVGRFTLCLSPAVLVCVLCVCVCVCVCVPLCVKILYFCARASVCVHHAMCGLSLSLFSTASFLLFPVFSRARCLRHPTPSHCLFLSQPQSAVLCLLEKGASVSLAVWQTFILSVTAHVGAFTAYRG